jgi:hypothetical protein
MMPFMSFVNEYASKGNDLQGKLAKVLEFDELQNILTDLPEE